MTTALQLQGVHKSFDSNAALVDASFSGDWGEVHALLGENGAGKSTLMNIACGLYAPDNGVVRVDGKAVTIDGPTGAQSLGIGMVHQHFKLVRSMTVAENIILGHGKGTWRQSQAYIRGEIAGITEQIGFSLDPNARIDELSVSEQQRVEIVKALVGGARILILDEPTAVLTDEESNSLLTRLRAFAGQGRCVIVITHKLREVLAHADRVTVMRTGETVAAGQSPAGMSAADLSRLMVGEAREYESGERSSPGEDRLTMRGISSERRRVKSPLMAALCGPFRPARCAAAALPAFRRIDTSMAWPVISRSWKISRFRGSIAANLVRHSGSTSAPFSVRQTMP